MNSFEFRVRRIERMAIRLQHSYGLPRWLGRLVAACQLAWEGAQS